MRVSLDPKHRHRAGALILASCALILLLIATVMTAQAYVTKVGEDTLEDFASGEFHRTSLVYIEDTGDLQDTESIQLVPIGLSGDWTQDEQHSLPMALQELAAVAGSNAAGDKGQVVVMGGTAPDQQPQHRSEVYISNVGADGMLGDWEEQTQAPLPQPISGAAAVLSRKDDNSSWIYLLGGTTGGDSLDSIYYTVLHHDTGTIDPWTTNPYTLTIPVYYEAAVVYDGYVYVAGGYRLGWQSNLYFHTTIANVFYAPIQPNGALGPWQETTYALPEPLSSHLLVAYGEGDVNTLYAIGGWDRKNAPSRKVYFADILGDHSVSDWTTNEAGNLPGSLYAHDGVMYNDQILLTGGIDARDSPSTTVQAALIDPDNTDIRLYDWCPPNTPDCTIGAWQSGHLLPKGLAFHATVEDRGYVYTLGGREKVDNQAQASDAVYWGTTNEPGATYSPWGHYISSDIDFGTPTTLRQVEWHTWLSPQHEDEMGIVFSCQYKPFQQNWVDCPETVQSVNGVNLMEFQPPPTDIRLFRYRLDMTTTIDVSSPLFDWIQVYHEVEDPEVAVRKDNGTGPGPVVSASLESPLDYTIYFTNAGGWVAENVVLTETLPAHTSYAGGPEWHQIGTSDVYTYLAGNLEPNATGNAPFRVMVDDQVPPGTSRITNTVEINYPPMIDALGKAISDTNLANNWFEFSNPLNVYHLSASQVAVPTMNSLVQPTSRITYTLKCLNGGSASVSGVVLTDVLPPGVTYVAGSIDPGPPDGDASDPTELKWDVGDMVSGQERSVQFAVTVDNDVVDGSRITNTFTVDSLQTDPRTSPDMVHIVDVPVIGFVITKTADPPDGSTVQPGQRITYTLEYFNNGDGTATGVTLVDDLPDGVTYVDGTIWPAPPQGDASNTAELWWNLDPVPAGSGGSAKFAVTVDQDAGYGITLTNQFSLDSDRTSLQWSSPVQHFIPTPSLVLTKTATPPSNSTVESGQTIAYVLSYRNDSGVPIDDLTLTDTLPDYVTYAPGSIWPSDAGNDDDTSELHWTIKTLAPGAKGTVGFSVQVDDVPGGLTIENQFEADSAQTDPQPSNLTRHVTTRQAPDLVVTRIKSVPTDPSPGVPFNLVVTIENIGSEDADTSDLWTEVYIKPYPSDAPYGPADHHLGYCTSQPCAPPYRAEYVEGLTSLGTQDSFALQFTGLVLPGGGHYDVYAQVDVGFDGDNPDWGRYMEENENNNTKHMILGGGIIYLPLVTMNH